MSIAKSIAERMDAEPKYANQSNIWLKLEVGFHTLRFCPPWSDEGIPYRRLDQHQGFTLDGKRVAPFCWAVIATSEGIAQVLADKGIITEDDYALAQEYGCPMCDISDKLIKMRKPKDKDDTDYQKFQVKSSYMFNTLVRKPEDKSVHNHVFVKSWSQTVFDNIRAATKAPHLREDISKGYLGVYDEKKGHDFTISATGGDGLNRRYQGLSFAPEKTPLNMAKGQVIHDLDDAMGIGVRSFATVLQLCETNHSAIVARSGIDLRAYQPKVKSTDFGKKQKSKK